jgi:selenocysteine-specific elongation factor
MAGQCAAINVGHWDHRIIRRGDTLTVPGYFSPQEWFICSLRLLPRDKLLLKSGAEVKFHTGTTEVAASFYPLKGNLMESGTADLIQIRTKTPIIAGPGDHFILRTPSPVRTIGGGRIVEAAERRLKGNRPGVMEDLHERAAAVLDDRRFVEYCIRRAESLAVDEPALAVRTKITRTRLREILADLAEGQTIFSPQGGLYVHRQTAAEAAESLVERVREFHGQSPERPGLPLEQLRKSMPVHKAVLDHLVARLVSEGRLVERNEYLALSEHKSVFRDEDAKLLDAVEALYRQRGFQPPSVDEVAKQTAAPPTKLQKILKLLREHGQLVQVEEGMLFHREAVERAKELLGAHFRKENRLESVQFKYLLDTTRKFALPLLDYMDKIGATRRVGNTRFANEKKQSP